MVTEPVRHAWVVPLWIELSKPPLRHTIVPAEAAEGWVKEVLRVASDTKTDREEEAYAAWEKKDGNVRLIATSDAHRIILLRVDGETPEEARTSLSDVLAAQGDIIRYVQ